MGDPQAAAQGPAVRQPITIDAVRASASNAGRATGNVARGVGGFLKPFRRVGNIVFLEVVSVFFFLFVIVFGNWAWRLHDQALHGPDHAKFLVYVGMMALFLYLSVSSYWRAKKK